MGQATAGTGTITSRQKSHLGSRSECHPKHSNMPMEPVHSQILLSHQSDHFQKSAIVTEVNSVRLPLNTLMDLKFKLIAVTTSNWLYSLSNTKSSISSFINLLGKKRKTSPERFSTGNFIYNLKNPKPKTKQHT